MEFVNSLWAMIVDALSMPFNDPGNGMNWLVAIVTAFLLLIILTVVVYGLFALLNYAFLPSREGEGYVFNKEKESAHSVLTASPVLGASGGISLGSRYVPKQWYLGVNVDGRSGWMSCGKKFYKETEVNTKVKVTYRVRRLTRSIDITCLEWRS